MLNRLFGARFTTSQGSDPVPFANQRASELSSSGRKVYVIPSGGSSPIGCLGYAACAHEIAMQARELGISFDRVVVPNGSSGTHAGLAAGFNALGISSQLVKSFAVHSPAAETRQATLKKARATALLVGAGQIGEGDIEVAGEQRGEGYGIPTAAMLAALRLVASREGLLLDPVYSGKAFAGLLEDVRRAPPSCGNVLFIMTGGVPSIFSYRSVF